MRAIIAALFPLMALVWPLAASSEFRTDYKGAWFPSGRIAFAAEAGGETRIGVLSFPGSSVQWISTPAGKVGEPDLSPDGRRLAVAIGEEGRRRIDVLESETGTVLHSIANPGDNSDPAWLSSGRELLFFRSDTPGNKHTEIYKWSEGVTPPSVVALTSFGKGKQSTPAMVGDGASIAYSTNRFWPGWDVCLMDLTSRTEKCPYGGLTTWCRPASSPNGSLMALSKGMMSKIDIVLLNRATGESSTLSQGALREYDAEFSPDGSHLAWAEETRKDTFEIVLYDIRGRKEVGRITSTASLRSPSWSDAPDAGR